MPIECSLYRMCSLYKMCLPLDPGAFKKTLGTHAHAHTLIVHGPETSEGGCEAARDQVGGAGRQRGAGKLFRQGRVLFPRDRKTEREKSHRRQRERQEKERRKREDDGVLRRVG